MRREAIWKLVVENVDFMSGGQKGMFLIGAKVELGIGRAHQRKSCQSVRTIMLVSINQSPQL
jgi:hypothetical protein